MKKRYIAHLLYVMKYNVQKKRVLHNIQETVSTTTVTTFCFTE